jgi:hypothetical protein
LKVFDAKEWIAVTKRERKKQDARPQRRLLARIWPESTMVYARRRSNSKNSITSVNFGHKAYNGWSTVSFGNSNHKDLGPPLLKNKFNGIGTRPISSFIRGVLGFRSERSCSITRNRPQLSRPPRRLLMVGRGSRPPGPPPAGQFQQGGGPPRPPSPRVQQQPYDAPPPRGGGGGWQEPYGGRRGGGRGQFGYN